MTKLYRFFFHYYKAKKAMSIHLKNTCYVVKDVKCLVPCETKWKSTQPQLVMQGFCTHLHIDHTTGVATIS